MSINIISGKTHCLPEEAGYASQQLNLIDNHLASLIYEKCLQSAGYCIAKDNKLIALKSMGRLRYNGESELQPDSIRRIASVTKAFTAVCILQLIEQGKMRLEQPVSEFIEEFKNPMYGKISIFHLLTHTSGVKPDPGVFFEPYPLEWWSKEENWIKEALRGVLSAEPGKEWRYSSTGFTILAEIVSRLSGISYEDYVIEKILKPLGMDNTFFDVPEEVSSRVCFTNEWEENWFNKRFERPKVAPPRGSGGLFSTMEDLTTFGLMLLNKGTFNGARILGRKSVEAATRNHFVNLKSYCWGCNDQNKEFGLGLDYYSNDGLLSSGSFAHEGAGRSGFFVDPVEKLVFTSFTPFCEGIDWDPRPVINLRNLVWAGII